MTRYVKIAFFKGALLKPLPPETSKQEHVRYFHIYEDDDVSESQLSKWVKQSSKLPGERM